MTIFICLVLDKECHVLKAATLCGENVSQAASLASKESAQLKGWGYELWQGGKLVRASYDCHAPPARTTAARFLGRPRFAT